MDNMNDKLWLRCKKKIIIINVLKTYSSANNGTGKSIVYLPVHYYF